MITLFLLPYDLQAFLSSLKPKQLAQRLLSGFASKGTTGAISKSEITLTGQAFQAETIPTSIKLYSKNNGSVYTSDSLAFAELSFSTSGSTYQKVLDGMAAKAGRGVSSANPFPPSLAQVDPSGRYDFQLGLALQVFSNAYGAPLISYWQGDLQVVDGITGQGSMGYEWNGDVTGTSTPVADKKVFKKILGSAASGYGTSPNGHFFDQPTTIGTASKVPQQPIAEAFVENKIRRAVGVGWPAVNRLLDQQGYPSAGLFDPIPGVGTPFVPNSFGI